MKPTSGKYRKGEDRSWQNIQAEHLLIKQEWFSRFRSTRRPGAGEKSDLRKLDHNWVGIGLGEKTTKGKGQRQLCLRFLVQKKKPWSKIPAKARLPSQIDGLPTDVVEVGLLKAFTGRISHPQHSPIGPGCSIGFSGPGLRRNAGTLGAIVEDATGKFILSCNHVFLDFENESPLPEIFHPGSLDDPLGLKVATIERRVPLVPEQDDKNACNDLDCAIARLVDGVDYTTGNALYPRPGTGILSYPGQEVAMIGRSGRKVGTVSPNSPPSVSMKYERGWVTLINQIEIEGLFEAGDSGGLIVDNVTKEAVGILCGGSKFVSYASPIRSVMQRLGVTFA